MQTELHRSLGILVSDTSDVEEIQTSYPNKGTKCTWGTIDWNWEFSSSISLCIRNDAR